MPSPAARSTTAWPSSDEKSLNHTRRCTPAFASDLYAVAEMRLERTGKNLTSFRIPCTRSAEMSIELALVHEIRERLLCEGRRKSISEELRHHEWSHERRR